MKIQINSNKLKKVINYLNSIITDFDPINENTGILIETLENKIVFKARNKHLTVKDEIILDNSEIDGFLIKSKTLNEAINKFDDEELIIEKNKNNSINISSENINYTLNLLNGNFNYLPINLNNFKKIFSIDANVLKTQIKAILFCASEKNQRIILRGINFEINKNEILMIASDETKIGISKIKNIKIEEEINFSVNILIIKDILKIIDFGMIDFFINEQSIILINNNKYIELNILENIYPKVTKFIPKSFKTELKIKKEELIKIFNRAMLINNIKTISETPVKLIIESKKLILETKDEGIGKALVKTIEFESNANEFSILFNPKFIVETIKTINDPTILINFNSSEDPFLVTGLNDKSHHVLILPYIDS